LTRLNTMKTRGGSWRSESRVRFFFPASPSYPPLLTISSVGLNLEQTPHDVRLFLPNSGKDGKGAELWVKSDVLSRASSYFKDLLSSGFAEATPRRSKRSRKSSTAQVDAPSASQRVERDFDDSDDETDDFHFSKQPPHPETSSDADELSYRQITITQTAFTTYRALLVFLHTGFIHFTPLSSSFPSRSDSRLDFITSASAKNPALPLPASSKSLYRLAHLLSLDDLQEQSLEALKSSLSVENAAVELFSDASIAYDEMRAVILEFVEDKWKEVRESEAWKDAMARFKAREMDSGAAAVLAEVLETVADA
jgi:hypothetical protein